MPVRPVAYANYALQFDKTQVRLHYFSMYLSDSQIASHPNISPLAVWSIWSVLTVESTRAAAKFASPEQIRSLHALLMQMRSLDDREDWESVTAATYLGIAEASSNHVYESLIYDLWELLSNAGSDWDVAAQLWPVRRWAERSLATVLDAIVGNESGVAEHAMTEHIRGADSMLRG